MYDYYIGCGVRTNVPSSYKNSKTPFQYAVNKYGVKSFIRTTLYTFDNEIDAYLKEAEIVNLEFISMEKMNWAIRTDLLICMSEQYTDFA